MANIATPARDDLAHRKSVQEHIDELSMWADGTTLPSVPMTAHVWVLSHDRSKRSGRRASGALASRRRTKVGPPDEGPTRVCELRDRYAPVCAAVCSVARSSLTPGPMVEETAARRR